MKDAFFVARLHSKEYADYCASMRESDVTTHTAEKEVEKQQMMKDAGISEKANSGNNSGTNTNTGNTGNTTGGIINENGVKKSEKTGNLEKSNSNLNLNSSNSSSSNSGISGSSSGPGSSSADIRIENIKEEIGVKKEENIDIGGESKLSVNTLNNSNTENNSEKEGVSGTGSGKIGLSVDVKIEDEKDNEENEGGLGGELKGEDDNNHENNHENNQPNTPSGGSITPAGSRSSRRVKGRAKADTLTTEYENEKENEVDGEKDEKNSKENKDNKDRVKDKDNEKGEKDKDDSNNNDVNVSDTKEKDNDEDIKIKVKEEGENNIKLENDNSTISLKKEGKESTINSNSTNLSENETNLTINNSVTENQIPSSSTKKPLTIPGSTKTEIIKGVWLKDDTEDVDDTLESEHFDTRQSFLNLCQGNHYQFDQLRRAKHTSMMVLYHLHNPDAPKFVSNCNQCHKDILIGIKYRCEPCEQDFCPDCYKNNGARLHIHVLKQVSVSAAIAPTALTDEQRRQRQQAIDLHLTLLVHASSCILGSDCKSRHCHKMKVNI